MPEAPITQGEIAALTRRFEEVPERTDREFGIVKSDLTALRLQVGNLDQKVGNLDANVNDLAGEVRVLGGEARPQPGSDRGTADPDDRPKTPAPTELVPHQATFALPGYLTDCLALA